ncbi:MAG: haloacid dehalogenase type II, partial [Pirellulaceae bacterium]|nr:haloacid dehalogenase type II [Pirellulaceae bacterium]
MDFGLIGKLSVVTVLTERIGALTVAILLVSMATFATAQHTYADEHDERNRSMSRPTVIIFDVNETLLDLAPLKKSVGKALDGREEMLPLWFSTMVHYSLVETLSGHYHDFGDIGTAALMMVAETHGIELSRDDAQAAIVDPLRSLPPHSDVVAGLRELKKDGFRIVSLTNSSSKGVEAQFKNADLTRYFEKQYSVDSIRKYKPHPDTYRMVLNDLGIKPEDALMV